MKWIYFSLLLVFCNLNQSKAQLVLGVEGGYGYLRMLEKQYFNPNGYTYDYGLKVGYRNAKMLLNFMLAQNLCRLV